MIKTAISSSQQQEQCRHKRCSSHESTERDRPPFADALSPNLLVRPVLARPHQRGNLHIAIPRSAIPIYETRTSPLHPPLSGRARAPHARPRIAIGVVVAPVDDARLRRLGRACILERAPAGRAQLSVVAIAEYAVGKTVRRNRSVLAQCYDPSIVIEFGIGSDGMGLEFIPTIEHRRQERVGVAVEAEIFDRSRILPQQYPVPVIRRSRQKGRNERHRIERLFVPIVVVVRFPHGIHVSIVSIGRDGIAPPVARGGLTERDDGRI
mmetsp:Transcript_46487/g.140834  ORF Transcript_46487/g.140834 Transcript_46487/m.140834 type:complete len:266 (-) Transcript_46487:795-1592(-)